MNRYYLDSFKPKNPMVTLSDRHPKYRHRDKYLARANGFMYSSNTSDSVWISVGCKRIYFKDILSLLRFYSSGKSLATFTATNGTQMAIHNTGQIFYYDRSLHKTDTYKEPYTHRANTYKGYLIGIIKKSDLKKLAWLVHRMLVNEGNVELLNKLDKAVRKAYNAPTK